LKNFFPYLEWGIYNKFEQQVPYFLLACGVSCFLHSTHMTFAKAGHPAFLFVERAVPCAAGLLFWPVEAIMVGFFTVRQIMANDSLGSGSCPTLGWRQDNGNRSNQKSKFDFLATRQCLVKIDEGQQKIKIVRTNRQSNLRGSCQSIFSLCRHHPSQLATSSNSNENIRKEMEKIKGTRNTERFPFPIFSRLDFLPLIDARGGWVPFD